MTHRDGTLRTSGDVIERLDDRIGRLLEERGEPGDVRVRAFQPAGPGAAAVVVDMVGGEERAQAFEVVIELRPVALDLRRRPASGVAPGVALVHLQARGATVVGVERDVGDEAPCVVDLGDGEQLDLERRPSLAFSPALMLEGETLAGGGEQSPRQPRA